MDDEDEKAWTAYLFSDSATDHVVGAREAFMAGRASVHGETFDGLRSRIAALEAVIAAVREHATRDANVGQPGPHDGFEEGLDHGAAIHAEATLRVLDLAPSVVLDGMIREAKAEAVEAARDAIMPPVNWNLRPDGTEMPGTQHVDEALHDIHVQLSGMAADLRAAPRG